jgi:hypothetical protein
MNVKEYIQNIFRPRTTIADKIHTSSLDESVQEARLLMKYAIQKGMKLDETLLATLTEANSLSQNKTWTLEKEIEFWKAYAHLAEFMFPVTVESIRDTLPEYGEPPSFLSRIFGNNQPVSFAQSAVSQYKLLGTFIIFIILILHIFWFIGTSLLTDNQQHIKEYAQNMIAMQSDTVKADSLQRNLLTLQTKNLEDEMRVNHEMLLQWNVAWRTLMMPVNLFLAQTKEKSMEMLPDETVQNGRAKIIATMYSTTFPLQIIQMYLLPLFYGLLGSCAYILQMLSAEIQNMTLTNEDKIRYGLRILLGALSGLVIGWFVPLSLDSNSETPITTTLSPLALSFLSGYSIEILFSAMDRFIGAFSAKGSK